MTLPLGLAIDLGLRLTGGAVLVSGIELYRLRSLHQTGGPWAFANLEHDLRSAPPKLKSFFNFVFADQMFAAVVNIQIALGALLLLLGYGAPWTLIATAAILQLLCSARFRGNVAGGADALLLHTLLALALAKFLMPATSFVARYAVAYIGIQAALSYVVAGVVKIMSREWRSGAALQTHLSSEAYQVPPLAIKLARPLGLPLSWGLILFELSLPLVLIWSQWLPLWMLLGLGFHLSNSAIFGFHRFFWVWLATYPALGYLSSLLAG